MTIDTTETTAPYGRARTGSGPEPFEELPSTTSIAVPAGHPTSLAMPVAPVAAALPVVPLHVGGALEPSPEAAQALRVRIDSLVVEAKATTGGSAAALWFEVGRIWEHELRNLREAAACYQESHKADATFLPVVHAARRLFAQLGKWGMVVVLLDAELRLPGVHSTALLLEKARIHENRLGRPDDALALYRQVLAAEPAQSLALDACVRLLVLRGAWSEVADVLQYAVQSAKRRSQQAAWLVDIARVVETHLHDDARAQALYEQADTLLPEQKGVLQALRRLYAKRGDVQRHADVLGQLADVTETPSEAVAFLLERARLLAAIDDVQALAALEAARVHVSDDVMVLVQLAAAHERACNWSALVEVLEAHARVTRDAIERAALTIEAGQLAEQRLNDLDRAIRLYRACLDADPGFVPALVALGRLFAKTGRMRDLADIYDIQIGVTSEQAAQVPLLFKQAELLADKLDDVDGAQLRLARILELQPGYMPAVRLRSSLLARQEKWEELIGVWERELAHGPDKTQSLLLLDKIARLAEDPLGRPDQAIDAYQRMLQVQPGHLPALRALGRIYNQQQRWDDLIRINLQESQTVTDQSHVVSLLFKNGEVLNDKLGRVDDAIDSFKKALALTPTFLPALKALGAIYARAGRFRDLVVMHRQEADVARKLEQRVHLLFMAAEVLEDKVGDVDQALATYHEVLAEQPGHHPSIRALQRIAHRRNDWDGLLAALALELPLLQDARDQAALRCRMAHILDRQLDKVDDAVAALEDAIQQAPSLLLAHEQLLALLARTGRADAEARARERVASILPEPTGRAANARNLAEILVHRLDNPGAALAVLRRQLDEFPDDISAMRLMLVCATRLRDYRAAIDAAQHLARVSSSIDEVVTLHLQIAAWKESHVEPPDDPLTDYVRILEYSPHHPLALRALERAYVERSAWDALYLLYDRERESLKDPQLMVDNAMRMGEIAEARLQRIDVAVQCYERALQTTRDYLPAIARLRDLYGRQGRPQDQLRLLTLEAHTSKDPARAVATLLEVGALQRDRFGDVDAAIDCFQRILERDPMHAVAYGALETMLVANSRWERLAQLYTQRARNVTELPQKVELLYKAAHLLGERMQKPAAAAEAYERLLQAMPGHVGALLQLGHLRFALQQWDEAVTTYAQLLPIAGDPLLLTPVHLNLGTIFTEHRPDPPRAITSLTACLAMQPDNRAARRLLAKAYGLAGSPAQALQAYKQLAESAADKAEKRELHLTLAMLFEASFPDPAQAASHIEAAMDLFDDPDEQQRLVGRLVALYEKTGNLRGLVDWTAKQAEAQAPQQPRRAAELHFRNARLLLERDNSPDAALLSARRALELAPDVVELRGFVADLLARTPNQALLAIEEHRKILRARNVRPASLRALHKLWYAQRAHDRAFCAAEVLSFLGAADEGEELYYSDSKKRMKKEATTEGLDATQLTSLVAHPQQRNAVREIVALCGQELAKLFADDHLEPVEKRFIFRAKADDSLRAIADKLAHNLDLPPSSFELWQSQTKKSGVEACAGSPLVLFVGADVRRVHSTREQCFLLGRKLMAFQSGHHLLRGMDAHRLSMLLTAIGRAVDKAFPTLADGAELEVWTKKVASALSRRTRAALAEPVDQVATHPRAIDLVAFLDAAPLTENHAGLLLAGAFDAAVRIIARDTGVVLAGDQAAMTQSFASQPQLADLVSYSVSDEYFQARQALHLAIDT